MGYRSEVAYRIVFGNEDVMKLFLAEAKVKLETMEAFVNAEEDGDFPDEAIRISLDEKEISFHAHGWKWYDEYEIVKAHTALIELAKTYNERESEDGSGTEAGDVSYAFARIGEDMEDNDTFGSDDHWELLDIERRIWWG
jgi:hypothetical protein